MTKSRKAKQARKRTQSESSSATSRKTRKKDSTSTDANGTIGESQSPTAAKEANGPSPSTLGALQQGVIVAQKEAVGAGVVQHSSTDQQEQGSAKDASKLAAHQNGPATMSEDVSAASIFGKSTGPSQTSVAQQGPPVEAALVVAIDDAVSQDTLADLVASYKAERPSAAAQCAKPPRLRVNRPTISTQASSTTQTDCQAPIQPNNAKPTATQPSDHIATRIPSQADAQAQPLPDAASVDSTKTDDGEAEAPAILVAVEAIHAFLDSQDWSRPLFLTLCLLGDVPDASAIDKLIISMYEALARWGSCAQAQMACSPSSTAVWQQCMRAAGVVEMSLEQMGKWLHSGAQLSVISVPPHAAVSKPVFEAAPQWSHGDAPQSDEQHDLMMLPVEVHEEAHGSSPEKRVERAPPSCISELRLLQPLSRPPPSFLLHGSRLIVKSLLRDCSSDASNDSTTQWQNASVDLSLRTQQQYSTSHKHSDDNNTAQHTICSSFMQELWQASRSTGAVFLVELVLRPDQPTGVSTLPLWRKWRSTCTDALNYRRIQAGRRPSFAKRGTASEAELEPENTRVAFLRPGPVQGELVLQEFHQALTSSCVMELTQLLRQCLGRDRSAADVESQAAGKQSFLVNQNESLLLPMDQTALDDRAALSPISIAEQRERLWHHEALQRHGDFMRARKAGKQGSSARVEELLRVGPAPPEANLPGDLTVSGDTMHGMARSSSTSDLGSSSAFSKPIDQLNISALLASHPLKPAQLIELYQHFSCTDPAAASRQAEGSLSLGRRSSSRSLSRHAFSFSSAKVDAESDAHGHAPEEATSDLGLSDLGLSHASTGAGRATRGSVKWQRSQFAGPQRSWRDIARQHSRVHQHGVLNSPPSAKLDLDVYTGLDDSIVDNLNRMREKYVRKPQRTLCTIKSTSANAGSSVTGSISSFLPFLRQRSKVDVSPIDAAPSSERGLSRTQSRATFSASSPGIGLEGQDAMSGGTSLLGDHFSAGDSPSTEQLGGSRRARQLLRVASRSASTAQGPAGSGHASRPLRRSRSKSDVSTGQVQAQSHGGSQLDRSSSRKRKVQTSPPSSPAPSPKVPKARGPSDFKSSSASSSSSRRRIQPTIVDASQVPEPSVAFQVSETKPAGASRSARSSRSSQPGKRTSASLDTNDSMNVQIDADTDTPGDGGVKAFCRALRKAIKTTAEQRQERMTSEQLALAYKKIYSLAKDSPDWMQVCAAPADVMQQRAEALVSLAWPMFEALRYFQPSD